MKAAHKAIKTKFLNGDYGVPVNCKAQSQNKAMDHRFVGIFESNVSEYHLAKRHMAWAHIHPAPRLPG